MAVVIWGTVTNPDVATVLIDSKLTLLGTTASNSADGYPAVNVTDQSTALSWKPESVPASLNMDLGAAYAVDSIGIAAHNLATSGAVIELQSSENGTTWSTIGTYDAVTNEDVFILFPQVTARYFRINVTSGICNIGVVYLGKKFTFPHPPLTDYTPLNQSRQYNKYFNDSLGGNFINTRVRSSGAETEVDMGFLLRTFTDSPMMQFKTPYDMGNCFFYAGCPGKYPLDMGYCRAGSQDSVVNVEYIERDYANVSFSLRAYVGTW